MRRVLVLLGGLLASLVAIDPAPAQGGTVARVGILCTVACAGREHEALVSELAKLGWVEGRTLTIDRRAAEGRIDRLPQLAADLVASRPDLIVAGSPQPNQAAKNATSQIPIVMIAVADPVAAGLAQSLARPGGNVTGVATLVPGGFIGKQVELLRELLPNARRLAALTNPLNDIHRRSYPLEVPPAAARLGFDLKTIEVRHRNELVEAITMAKAHGAEALLVIGDPLFHVPADRVPTLVAGAAIPAIYLPRGAVEAGGLMSYGPDFLAMYRRAAHFVDRILKGANPAETPIEQPTKFELVINLRTAKSLALEIPPTLLARADEVIE
jgi:putative tryptophan/tyrosine transport system substrate-binding protein